VAQEKRKKLRTVRGGVKGEQECLGEKALIKGATHDSDKKKGKLKRGSKKKWRKNAVLKKRESTINKAQ